MMAASNHKLTVNIEVWKSPPDSLDLWQTKIGSEPVTMQHQEIHKEAKRHLQEFLDLQPELQQWTLAVRATDPETGVPWDLGHATQGLFQAWKWDPKQRQIVAISYRAGQ